MDIPQFPLSRPLELYDKSLFDTLCANLQPRVSEITFAGLYLFRKAHEYRLTMVSDSIIILGKKYDGANYFLPPFCGDIVNTLTTMISKNHLSMYGADDKFIKQHLTGNSFEIIEQRDLYDYLYLREDLATLPGKRFHKKKNRIRYFTNRHEYKIDGYSDKYLAGCLNLLKLWQKYLHGDVSKSVVLEIEAATEALNRAGTLGLEGVVVVVNDIVVAFALGERLNRDTAVCHFEKADPFFEGLYQLVNREFARLLFNDCLYVNREQDLGNMGLRNAKLSYHPVALVKKYVATHLKHKDSLAS